MSELSNIRLAQELLEECCSRKMAEIEAQLQSAAAAKETVAKITVAKVYEEFRIYRELTYSMLGLLRKQIADNADNTETRHRRKALVFLGVKESEKEDCMALILDIISKRMGLSDISASSVRACHRLGVRTNRPRPILIRFEALSFRSAVWRAKTKLKGSSVAVREFLTKPRQAVFTEARQHFGMRACWTQDGVIVIRVADGSRHKVTTADELKSVIARCPSAVGESSSGGKGGDGGAATTIAVNKVRKN